MVAHAAELTLGSYVKVYRSYGRGAARYHRTRAARGTGGLGDLVPFYTRLPGLLWRSMSRLPLRQRCCVALLVVVWQLANLSGFLSASRGGRN